MSEQNKLIPFRQSDESIVGTRFDQARRVVERAACLI